MSMAELAAPADTVALSLNKGLCAPFGAVLGADMSVIEEARVNARRVGAASVHQAYIAAAAGIVGLERMYDRIADDHRRARELAERLDAIEGVTAEPPPTNIVFFSIDGRAAEQTVERLAAAGIRGFPRDTRRIRLVTHSDIGGAEVDRAVAAVAAIAAIE
jgi:threonine aldolase